jgi:hypothetical protein
VRILVCQSFEEGFTTIKKEATMKKCSSATSQEEGIVPEATLEERVVKLEKLVDTLLQRVDISVHKKDWRRTVGMFDGDPLMKEIIEAGQRVREEDRRKTSV